MPSSQADLVEVAIAPRDMWVNLTCKILSILNTDAQVMSADVLISSSQIISWNHTYHCTAEMF